MTNQNATTDNTKYFIESPCEEWKNDGFPLLGFNRILILSFRDRVLAEDD